MADFLAVTACNGPRLTDPAAVQKIIDRYCVDPDLYLGIETDPDTGAAHLILYGYVWPEIWAIPAGVAPEEFNPYDDEHYEAGGEGLVQLLQEIASYLAEPLTVHAIGHLKCRFPLAACEWHIRPGNAQVVLNEFRHDAVESVVVISPAVPPLGSAAATPGRGSPDDGSDKDRLSNVPPSSPLPS